MRRHAAFVALSCAILTLSACGPKGEKGTGAAVSPQRVTGVTVETVAEQEIPDLMEVTGTVRARTVAVVAARIPGTVSVVHVREGDRVKKGQLLARLDSRESLAGAAGAAAAMDEAQRGVDEAKSRKKLADATLDRYQKLYAEQAVTRHEFEVRETEREVAAQGLARAEARLRQAQEASRSAAAVADHTRVVSPLAGIVTAKSVDAGGTVFPAQPLFTIEEGGSFRLELAVPESLSGKVRVGMPLQVRVEDNPIQGSVAEIVPAVDPASRTFVAKVNLPGTGYRSGMFGRASFPVGVVKGFVIPAASIREQGNLTAVWAVDKDNIVRMRLVKPGKKLGARQEILAGISAGDRIVTSGMEKVTEGVQIQ